MSTVSQTEVERLFITGYGVADICRKLNASTDVVEDAIRECLRDWRFKARQLERNASPYNRIRVL